MNENSDSPFREWEQVHFQSHHHFHGRDWELVGRSSRPTPLPFDHCLIFPPSSHEDLHMPTEENPLPEFSSESDINGVPRENPLHYLDSKLSIARELLSRIWKLSFEVLYSRIMFVFRRRSDSWAHFVRGAFWSSRFLAVSVGLVGAVMFWRHLRGRLKKNDVLVLIKEQDEKISQLWHQVAQLNESISARYSVPIIRSS